MREQITQVSTAPIEDEREFTIRAVVTGTVLGLIFAVASLYLVFKFGITASVSLPVAVLGIAGFSLCRRIAGTAAGSKKEYATIQTIGSVGESLAFTVGLAVPVFDMLKVPLERWQVFLVTCGGGVVGCLVLVPFWKTVRDGVFPEGQACARIIQAATHARDAIVPLLQGLLTATVYVVIRPFTALVTPSVGLELMPELMGIGYVIGTRAALTLGFGGLAAFFSPTVFRLLGKSQNNEESFVFLAVGAIASSAVIMIIKRWKSSTVSGHSMDGIDPQARDLRPSFIWIVAAVSLILSFGAVAVPLEAPSAWLVPMGMLAAVLCFVFARFSANVAGKIGSSANPISAMALISAVAAAALMTMLPGNGSRDAAVLTVALVVAMAATCAGMTAQVLKTSELVGATRRKQEIGVIIGTITSSAMLAWSLPLLRSWMVEPGPPSRLLYEVVEKGTSKEIQWSFVLVGIFVTLLLNLLGISSFIFAVGLYLKIKVGLPIGVGGLIFWATERWVTSSVDEEHEVRRQPFSLFASGVIAGGVIAGMGVSVLVARFQPPGAPPWKDSLLTLLLFAMLAFAFVKTPMRRRRDHER